MAKAYNYMPLLVIAAIGFGGWYLFTQTDVFKGQVTPGDGVSDGGVTVISTTSTGTFTARNATDAKDMKGSSSFEVRYANGASKVGETAITAAPHSISSLPNSMNGFLMVGNDNRVATTDTGLEIYYTKKSFSYTNQLTPDLGTFNVYPEATSITNTCYDDGTSESTCNVTVGTTIVDSTELKLATASKGCIGNPTLKDQTYTYKGKTYSGKYPIAVWFNTTNSTFASELNEIRPINYIDTVTLPEFTSGMQAFGSVAYILPTEALCDMQGFNTEYRYSIRIDPKVNPSVLVKAIANYLDLSNIKDDDGNWVIGWAYDTSISGKSDTEIGIEGGANSVDINFS